METKLIRLHKPTYDRLDACRGKRETFNECINRLIDVWVMVNDVKTTLGPSHYLMGDQNRDK